MNFLRTRQTLLSGAISANTSGDNTIIAGVAGKVIAAYLWRFTVAGTVSITWKRGSTALSGAYPFFAGGGDEAAPRVDQEPWYQTGVGEALVINLSANVLIAGTIYYAVLD